MSVKVSGKRDFKSAMKKLGGAFNDAVEQGVFVTSEEVRKHAIKSIQKVSPGNQVQRSRQGGGTYTHTAAAAGNAPNTDTGKLVASIASERVGLARYKIGTNLDYGAFLEFGTSRMQARPWLMPASRAKAKNLKANITKVLNIYINRLPK